MVDQFMYIITGTEIPNRCRVQGGFQCFQKIITEPIKTGGTRSQHLWESLFLL